MCMRLIPNCFAMTFLSPVLVFGHLTRPSRYICPSSWPYVDQLLVGFQQISELFCLLGIPPPIHIICSCQSVRHTVSPCQSPGCTDRSHGNLEAGAVPSVPPATGRQPCRFPAQHTSCLKGFFQRRTAFRPIDRGWCIFFAPAPSGAARAG